MGRMKKNIVTRLALYFVVLFVSCSGNSEKEFLMNAIKQANVDTKYEWIIILPGLGCHGCIQEGEFFMQENVSNPQMLFVLTNIESLKIFQQKTDIKVSEHSNIYIDRDNHFKLLTENAIYPCIIHMVDGKISQCIFQSPKTDAFHKLRKSI